MADGTESTSLVACVGARSPVLDALPEAMDGDCEVVGHSSVDGLLDGVRDVQRACVVIDRRGADEAPGAPTDEASGAPIEAVRRNRPDLPIVAVAADAATGSAALEAGATDVLVTEAGRASEAMLAARIRHAMGETSSQRFHETLIEHSTDVVTALGPDGSVIYQSPSVERQLGHDPGALLGEDAFEYIHPEDRERVEAAFLDLIESERGVVEDVEYRFRHADGSWLWVESVASHQGPPGDGGFVVNSRIIQDRKERECELAQSETVFENVQDAVFLVDVAETGEFEVRHVNPAYEEMTGLDSGTLTGKSPHEIVGEADGERIEAKYRECVERQTSLSYDETFDNTDLPRHLRTRIAPVVVDGEVESIAGATRDVTTQKEYERAIERRFDEFSEVLAEDLRVPLDRAVTELVAVRGPDGEGSLEDAITWLRRADSMLEDISIVHSNAVPDREVAETRVAGSLEQE